MSELLTYVKGLILYQFLGNLFFSIRVLLMLLVPGIILPALSDMANEHQHKYIGYLSAKSAVTVTMTFKELEISRFRAESALRRTLTEEEKADLERALKFIVSLKSTLLSAEFLVKRNDLSHEEYVLSLSSLYRSLKYMPKNDLKKMEIDGLRIKFNAALENGGVRLIISWNQIALYSFTYFPQFNTYGHDGHELKNTYSDEPFHIVSEIWEDEPFLINGKESPVWHQVGHDWIYGLRLNHDGDVYLDLNDPEISHMIVDEDLDHYSQILGTKYALTPLSSNIHSVGDEANAYPAQFEVDRHMPDKPVFVIGDLHAQEEGLDSFLSFLKSYVLLGKGVESLNWTNADNYQFDRDKLMKDFPNGFNILFIGDLIGRRQLKDEDPRKFMDSILGLKNKLAELGMFNLQIVAGNYELAMILNHPKYELSSLQLGELSGAYRLFIKKYINEDFREDFSDYLLEMLKSGAMNVMEIEGTRVALHSLFSNNMLRKVLKLMIIDKIKVLSPDDRVIILSSLIEDKDFVDYIAYKEILSDSDKNFLKTSISLSPDTISQVFTLASEADASRFQFNLQDVVKYFNEQVRLWIADLEIGGAFKTDISELLLENKSDQDGSAVHGRIQQLYKGEPLILPQIGGHSPMQFAEAPITVFMGKGILVDVELNKQKDFRVLLLTPSGGAFEVSTQSRDQTLNHREMYENLSIVPSNLASKRRTTLEKNGLNVEILEGTLPAVKLELIEVYDTHLLSELTLTLNSMGFSIESIDLGVDSVLAKDQIVSIEVHAHYLGFGNPDFMQDPSLFKSHVLKRIEVLAKLKNDSPFDSLSAIYMRFVKSGLFNNNGLNQYLFPRVSDVKTEFEFDTSEPGSVTVKTSERTGLLHLLLRIFSEEEDLFVAEVSANTEKDLDGKIVAIDHFKLLTQKGAKVLPEQMLRLKKKLEHLLSQELVSGTYLGKPDKGFKVLKPSIESGFIVSAKEYHLSHVSS